MPDREKVTKGLECHAKGARGCLFDCPYGNENGCQLLLCSDALALLKEQDETINDLTYTIRNLNQHIKDLSEYMTPYGIMVKDIKAAAELLKEQENASKRNPVIVCPHCGKRVK